MAGMKLRMIGTDGIDFALDPVKMKANAQTAMDAILLDAASFLSEESPVGVYGNLATSWGAGKGVEWQGETMTGFMDPTPVAPYAWQVVYGRAPGRMPPSAELVPWVTKKLGFTGTKARSVAFLIARSIGRRGTKGNDFPQRVIDARRERWQRVLTEALSAK